MSQAVSPDIYEARKDISAVYRLKPWFCFVARASSTEFQMRWFIFDADHLQQEKALYPASGPATFFSWLEKNKSEM